MINPDALKLVPTPIAWLGEGVQLTFDRAIAVKLKATKKRDGLACRTTARVARQASSLSPYIFLLMLRSR